MRNNLQFLQFMRSSNVYEHSMTLYCICAFIFDMKTYCTLTFVRISVHFTKIQSEFNFKYEEFTKFFITSNFNFSYFVQ